MHINNKSWNALTKNPVYHERSKYIDIRYHFSIEHIKDKEVELQNVKSQDQTTNIFTKTLVAGIFNKISIMFGLIVRTKLDIREDIEK